MALDAQCSLTACLPSLDRCGRASVHEQASLGGVACLGDPCNLVIRWSVPRISPDPVQGPGYSSVLQPGGSTF